MLEKSRLWKVFLVLSRAELKRLKVFLASPYQNQREDVCAVIELLMQVNKQRKMPSGEEFWEFVYGNEDFSPDNLRHLMNYTLQAIERFLVHQDFAKDKFSQQWRLAEIYQNKGLEDLTETTLNRSFKTLKGQKIPESDRLLRQFQYHQLRFRAHDEKGRSFRSGLQELSDSLDVWFVAQKLKQACAMLSQRKMFQADYQLELLEPVVETAARSAMKDEPLVAVYLATYFMLLHPEDEDFFVRQTTLLGQHQGLLSSEDQRTLYLMAVNYCIARLNKGEKEYLQEVYHLYQLGLKDGWLYEKNELSPWTYKNIVSAGLKLGDHTGVEGFIEKYRDRLPDEFRFIFSQYNLAELQLARGEWQKVLRSLRFLQIKDPLTSLRARIAQIKAGFELGEIQLIEHQLDNLRQLLRRKKELTYHKTSYRNFERLVHKLIRIRPGDELGRERFLEEVDSAELLVEGEWLREKAREI